MEEDRKLHAIVIYRKGENTYTKVAHNMLRKDAETEVDMLRHDKLPAFLLEQDRQHKGFDATACADCDEMVMQAFSKHTPAPPKAKQL